MTAINQETAVEPDELDEARSHAFCLIRDMQAGDAEAPVRLANLVEQATRRGWQGIDRIGAFGAVVGAWLGQDDRLPALVEELIGLSEQSDPAMLAVGLSLRSSLPAPGSDAALSASRDADLARAVVILETAEGNALEMVTARTGCAISFGLRSMWELSDGQYQAALTLKERLTGPARDAVLSAVVFNRAENQVAWASTLRQIGDRQGVDDRWKAWELVSGSSERYHMPQSWRDELSALGLLLGAIAGQDRASEVIPLLPDEPGVPGRHNPTEAHLRLALALSDSNAGRAGAMASTEAAVAVIDPQAHPHMYDLALYLAAELESGPARGAGLRCADRQIQQNWVDRLAKLNAMRTRIDAERMIADHERLTREATLDHLTGIGNRRALDIYLDELRHRDVPGVALMMTDVDGFKEVNDRHGHHSGDSTLVAISRVLEGNIRPTDRAVRLGGDEFMVIMADAGLDAARERAEQVMSQIESYPWEDTSPGLKVTVSIGVAAGPLSGLELVSVCADAAVYAAKAAGGNTIVCHEPR